MTNIIDLLGRIFISVLFFINGIFKINNYEGTIEWMDGYGTYRISFNYRICYPSVYFGSRDIKQFVHNLFI